MDLIKRVERLEAQINQILLTQREGLETLQNLQDLTEIELEKANKAIKEIDKLLEEEDKAS